MSPAVLLSRRARAFRFLIVVVFAVMVLRLIQVQEMGHAHYAALSRAQTATMAVAPPMRGTIYDRNANIMATTVLRPTVQADYWQVVDRPKTALALASALGLPAADVEKKLETRNGGIAVAHRVSDAVAAKIAKMHLPGISLVQETQRVVPVGRLAQVVIGTVDGQGAGNSGLEMQYQDLLSGKTAPGTHTVAAISPRTGTGIELTLDKDIQWCAEQALGNEIAASHATGGTAIVMDVRTGEILAMANLSASKAVQASPGADAAATSGGSAASSASAASTSGPSLVAQVNTLPAGVEEGLANAALTSVYEPGSIFKLVTFSAALANGTVTPTTPIPVGAQKTVGKYVYKDAEAHGAEVLTPAQILAQSSNLGTIEIASRLGWSRQLRQVARLGFGRPTGLNFPAESAGLASPQYTDTSLFSVSIGQAISVTPQQILDAYNAVANGGVFVAPKLVRATVDAQGRPTATGPSATHPVIDPATDRALVSMLEGVVTGGTGTAAAVPGYTVAGKTGTAAIPGRNGYEPGAYNASFVGFAPAERPVLSAMVVLNRPTPIYGGAVAAPVFSQIMSWALAHYRVPTSSAPSAPTPNPATGPAGSVAVPAGARTEGA